MLDNAFSKRNDFRVVGFANDAMSAVDMIRKFVPDVVTIDLCMPYLDGAGLLDMIKDLRGVCKIVVSDNAMNNLMLTAKLLEAGASVCIAKSDLSKDPAGFFKRINTAVDAMASAKRDPLSPIAARLTTYRHATPTILAKSVMTFPVPTDESERIRFIDRNGLANASRERKFDLVTQHVAKATVFPACLLTIIDRDTQWIKSAYGLEVESTPRHQAFCNYTISQGGIFAVSNAATDPRFSGNALVTGLPNIKSYAGHPVENSAGVVVASLCVIDTRVRTVSRHVIEQLAGMAQIVGEMLDPHQPAARGTTRAAA
jgi:DNA-binding NarL/FixJ family response regulator